MKTLCNIALFLLLPFFASANGLEKGKHNKQKHITKAYKVNSDAGIDIDNQFGPVFVTTWDEDKIELDIVIKVSGNNEAWVDKRLSSIDVEINALTTLVSARTKIGHISGRSGNGNSMEISYTIKIPKKGGMKVSNKYGDVISTDINGPVRLNVQYGNLKLSQLNNTSNIVNLEYSGSAHIEKIKVGSIKADYSKLFIGNFEAISVETNYTDVHASDGGNVQYRSDYGKLSFRKVNNIDGKGDYLTMVSTDVSGNLSFRGDYTTIRVDNLKGGGNVSISGNYSTTSIGYADNYAFDFEIRGKYTNIRLDNDLELLSKVENNREKVYKGRNKSGGRKIFIDGEYGNVSLKNNR